MSLIDIPPSSFIPDSILRLDYEAFYKVNEQWHNSFFDTVLPFIREPSIWIPFYFFMLLFGLINFKLRGVYWVVFFIITAMLSDYISSSIIKENFTRLRPCREPFLVDQVRFLVSYCPRSSSFTSSHAVNHFAISMYIFTTFKKSLSPKWALMFLWAFAISYAQVYVGVHFPLDVICGALVGLIIGYIPAKVFNTKIGLLQH
ncbi:MAG: phosphatase PAP2 family protein [Ginsengibacter sp.]